MNSEILSRNKKLDYLIQLAPEIREAIPLDVMIGVTDTEKFLLYIPAKNLCLGDITGMAIPEGDAIYEAVKTGKTQMCSVPKEAFGIPFKAKSVPIKDEKGNVVGGLGIGVSLENQEKLSRMSHYFALTSEEIAASTEELSSSAQDLANLMESLYTSQKEMSKQVNKTENILSFINSIARSSMILGLNAGIEAARAGEHSRGFGVVAQEIRKLAENSTKSVDEIRDLLILLRKKVDYIAETVQKVREIANQQSASSQEIASAINHLASAAEDIEKLAEII